MTKKLLEVALFCIIGLMFSCGQDQTSPDSAESQDKLRQEELKQRNVAIDFVANGNIEKALLIAEQKIKNEFYINYIYDEVIKIYLIDKKHDKAISLAQLIKNDAYRHDQLENIF